MAEGKAGGGCVAASAANDRAVLMGAFTAWGSPHSLTKWGNNWGSDRPISEWEGVTVNEDDRVVKIILEHCGLKGNK